MILLYPHFILILMVKLQSPPPLSLACSLVRCAHPSLYPNHPICLHVSLFPVIPHRVASHSACSHPLPQSIHSVLKISSLFLSHYVCVYVCGCMCVGVCVCMRSLLTFSIIFSSSLRPAPPPHTRAHAQITCAICPGTQGRLRLLHSPC